MRSLSFVKAGMAACVVAAMSFAATDVQANLLTNPGFEGAPIASGPPPFTGRWEPFGASGPVLPSLSATGTVMPRTGVQHLELVLDNVGASFAGVFQDVGGLNAGEILTWEGWTKDNGQDAGGAEVRIEWRDSVNDVEITRTGNLVPVLTPGVYTPWSLTDTVPAGADSARVVYAIQSFGAGPNQIHYVDDTSVTVIPEPASLALLGLGGLAMLRRR